MHNPDDKRFSSTRKTPLRYPAKQCVECGREYFPVHKPQLFCSRSCSLVSRSRDRKLTGAANPNWKGGTASLSCERCGVTFEVPYNRRDEARYCTLECFNQFQRESSPARGEVRVKRVALNCVECGTGFEVIPGLARTKFCGQGCHLAWRSKIHSGAGNPNWNGGLSKLPYPFSWPQARKAIVQRDGGLCQNTTCWKSQIRITVHHIDYDKFNLDPSNLITVCASCNTRANFGRDVWMLHYAKIMEGK